jgi:dihydrodipicolinate synthase/N-acetylneuraminate lyase
MEGLPAMADILQAGDIRGTYAIIPTPARAGASSILASDTVDLTETERLVSALIRDGVDGIIALGTTGECATLMRRDYEQFVTCVVETVGRRVPTFMGATALGAHEAVDRLRFLRACGSDGTLLGLPMWQPLTLPMAVRYYTEISEALPGLAIMVYANTRAFRFDFPIEFWEAVGKQATTVVCAKCSRAPRLLEMIAVTGGRIQFIPNDAVIQDFHAASPETTISCWSTAASMGPAPAMAIMSAVRSGQAGLIQRVSADIAWANEPIQHIIDNPTAFASHNIQVEKARMAASGYCNPGPARPPYDVIPDDMASASREAGQRWAELCRRYSNPLDESAAKMKRISEPPQQGANA